MLIKTGQQTFVIIILFPVFMWSRIGAYSRSIQKRNTDCPTAYLEEGEVCKAAVEETGLSGHGVRALDGEGGRARRRDHREVGAVKLRVYRP